MTKGTTLGVRNWKSGREGKTGGHILSIFRWIYLRGKVKGKNTKRKYAEGGGLRPKGGTKGVLSR